MSWDYRVVKKEDMYGIHEVYYDDDGKPYMCTENPITMDADSENDLEWMLENVAPAVNHPWLNYTDFCEETRGTKYDK